MKFKKNIDFFFKKNKRQNTRIIAWIEIDEMKLKHLG
jgi:hypothetical protein